MVAWRRMARKTVQQSNSPIVPYMTVMMRMRTLGPASLVLPIPSAKRVIVAEWPTWKNDEDDDDDDDDDDMMEGATVNHGQKGCESKSSRA
jgi:hypothetical protein